MVAMTEKTRAGIRTGGRIAFILGLAALVGAMSVRTDNTVWQLDPNVCVQCGNCAVECVLTPSAVKCVHVYGICGYCDLCSGYFRTGAPVLDTGADFQACPTGALQRRFVEEPFFEYTVDESLCIGCAQCVVGCTAFGNGSLFLQVRYDRCLNCNDCSIARRCPSGAYSRVPMGLPYRLKGSEGLTEAAR